MRGTGLGTGAKTDGLLIQDMRASWLAAREPGDGKEEMTLGGFWRARGEGALQASGQVEKESWESAICGEIITNTSSPSLDVMLSKTPQ